MSPAPPSPGGGAEVAWQLREDHTPPRTWLELLLADRIGPACVEVIPKLAVMHTIVAACFCEPTGRADDGTTFFLNAQRPDPAVTDKELGWESNTLWSLATDRSPLSSTQVDELFDHPTVGPMLALRLQEETRRLADLRRRFRGDLRVDAPLGVLLHAGPMNLNVKDRRAPMPPRMRHALEADALRLIAQLATGQAFPAGQPTPDSHSGVDWARVAAAASLPAPPPTVTIRQMVREAVAEAGRAVNRPWISHRIRQRYGQYAPTDRQVTQSLVTLAKAGELQRTGKGYYVTGPRFASMRRRTDPTANRPLDVPRLLSEPRT